MPTSFEVTGSQSDTEGPQLVELSISPGSVDAGSASVTVTVRARIKDNLSGLEKYNGSIRFDSPSWNQSVEVDLDEDSRVSGTARDGYYEAVLSLPQYPETGTWIVDRVSLYDKIGNNRWEEWTDLRARGLPYSFKVTKASNYDLELSRTTEAMIYGGGSRFINVISDTSWNWSSDSVWLEARGEHTWQSGNQTFSFSAAANTSTFERTGKVTFRTSDEKITRILEVRQAASPLFDPGIIFTWAGDGTYALLYYPRDLAFDAAGNLHFSTSSSKGGVQRVAPDGTITTYPGVCSNVRGIAFDAAGNLFFADPFNHQVRRVDAAGSTTTVAGNGDDGEFGYGGFGGDGGDAVDAQLAFPMDVAVDVSGNLFISDRDNHRVRRVDPGGIITTYAGNGSSGYAGRWSESRPCRTFLA